MARVAVAYVEVRPDLDQFGERLRAALTKIKVTEKVKIDLDSKTLSNSIANATTKGSALARKEMSKADIKAAQQYGKIIFDADKAANQRIWKERLASFKEGQALQLAGIKDQERAEKLRDANRVKRTRDFYAVSLNLAKFQESLNKEVADSESKTAALRQKHARDMFGVSQNLASFQRGLDKETASTQEKHARDMFKVSQSLGAFRRAVDKETADHADKVNRESAENYVRFHQRALDRRLALGDLEIRNIQHVSDRMRTDFETRFGNKLGNVFRPLDNQLDRAMRRAETKLILRPKMDSTRLTKDMAGIVRKIGSVFGSRSIVGRTVGALGSLIASTMEVAGSVSAKVFETFASSAADAGKTASKSLGAAAGGAVQVGAASATAAADIAAMATSVGGLVAILTALVLASALVVVAVSAVELVLGAILAVVIPLVGGITALVAELSALAGVGVGAIGLLPGALLAAAAAFGPLLLVADKFQKLFENTEQHTGALFVVMEHLKNAIFAVMTTGFIDAIKTFATDVLPKMVNGITLVSEAWNKLFLGLVKLASTPAAIGAINAALQAGARIVDLFAQAVKDIGPGLLDMAVAGLPAVESLLRVVSSLITEFGRWINEVNSSGQFASFFGTLTVILRRVLDLLRPIASTMSSWIVAILPPAQQFLDVLAEMADRWKNLAGSAAGQNQITAFFVAMNRIVLAFEPVLEKIVATILDFGPTLADLVDSAIPALNAVIDTIKNFLESAAPWLEMFMRNFAAQLADPTVQTAISELGAAMGLLLNSFTSFGTTGLQTVIYGIAALAIILSLVIGKIQELNSGVQKLLTGFVDLSAYIPAVQLGKFIAKLTGVSGAAKDTTGQLNTMGNTGKTAAEKSAAAMNVWASIKGWGEIKDNIGTVTDYLADMANVGIEGNEKLISSMARLASAAYSTKNEADMATFEKNLGRAFKQPTGTLGRVAKPMRKAGAAAGTAFSTAYNSTVTTKADTSKKKNKAGVLASLKPALSGLDVGALIHSRLAGSKAYDTGWEIAGYVAKGLTSGGKNIAKVQSYIYKKMGKDFKAISKSIETFVKDANKNIGGLTAGEIKALKGAKTASQMQDILTNARQRQNELLQTIKTFKTQVEDALAPRKSLVNLFGYIPTPAEVKAELDDQLAVINRFTSGLDALAKLGLSPELRKAWIEAGVDTAGNMVEGLRDATPEQITAINNAYNAVNDKAKTVSEQQATQWFGVGQATVEGYIAGIDSMQTALRDAMVKALAQAYKDAKAFLKQKSPSKLYADMGVGTMAGYIQGVDSMASDTVDAIGKVFDAAAGVETVPLTVPPLSLPPVRYASPTTLDTFGAAPITNVKVFLGDKELTDMVRIVVDDADSTRARALNTGRR